MTALDQEAGRIPEQGSTPWRVALAVSWAGLKRRILRSFITMLGIILAIAFLTYLLAVEDVTRALVAANRDALNVLLQKSGVDIYSAGRTDRMMLLLIGLSLFTCLVGIINAMLMSVMERVREIGTMKCLGARDSFILKTYFIESVLLGFIGTVAGILTGLLVAVGVSLSMYGGAALDLFPWRAVLASILVALGIGSAISVVAALAPALWAARKEPVEAMRVEE